MRPSFYLSITMVLLLLLTYNAEAQFEFSGQLRTRSELRQGQGTLPITGADPAFFTSQRTRFNVGYKKDRITFYTSLQDVRVWGQDVSTINRNTMDFNMGLMLHQAYAEIQLSDTSAFIQNAAFKIGRQELVYNDHRLLGNLDWLQQGRRHDMLLFKTHFPKWYLHAGVAYNQNNERKHGTVYAGIPDPSLGFVPGYPPGTNQIGTMYKSAQFLYVNRTIKPGQVNFLFFKDDFNRFERDGGDLVFQENTWSRMTTGLNSEMRFFNNDLYLNASVYAQGGRDMLGNNLRAWMASVYSNYKVAGGLSIGPGVDILSGNDGGQTSGVNRAFDPLYGTPHKFWGLMDYFYVADPFARVGLNDFYFRTKYQFSEKFFAFVDVHEFHSYGRIFGADAEGGQTEYGRRLGTEVDLILNYQLMPGFNIEGGYAMFFATESLKVVKPPFTERNNIGHWAYLMLNVTI
ncbi:alginate export family protein [Cytophagaceae bacterium ABcell3]|nr:alginate export family protein [Cytophagaceae bacterium ABcell3]